MRTNFLTLSISLILLMTVIPLVLGAWKIRNGKSKFAAVLVWCGVIGMAFYYIVGATYFHERWPTAFLYLITFSHLSFAWGFYFLVKDYVLDRTNHNQPEQDNPITRP